ncbi:hypothetical protein D3C86_1677510 [compost metagenome]
MNRYGLVSVRALIAWHSRVAADVTFASTRTTLPPVSNVKSAKPPTAKTAVVNVKVRILEVFAFPPPELARPISPM